MDDVFNFNLRQVSTNTLDKIAELAIKQSQEKETSLKPEDNKENDPAIVIDDLSKVFIIGKEKVRALYNVNLTIYEDEIVCLLGTSGSGKSTLLKRMAGLEKPTKGSCTIFVERVDKMCERKLAVFRQKIMGFVFQSYNLLPTQNAIDNVSMPLAFAGMKRKDRTKRSKEMLKLVGLGKRMKHKPTRCPAVSSKEWALRELLSQSQR